MLIIALAALTTLANGRFAPPAEESTDSVRIAGPASLEKLRSMPGYRLTVRTAGQHDILQVHLPFPVYRLDYGDVNGDGRTDILLGVIKPTHFDPEVKRRLFIYQAGSEALVPLWLGSRVCLRLVDFRCVRENAQTSLLTIEQDANGTFCNGVYQWRDFGLELQKYHNEETSYGAALEYFNRHPDDMAL